MNDKEGKKLSHSFSTICTKQLQAGYSIEIKKKQKKYDILTATLNHET